MKRILTLVIKYPEKNCNICVNRGNAELCKGFRTLRVYSILRR